MAEQKKSLKLNAILSVIKQLCMIIYPMITFPYASRVLGASNYGKINFGNSIISYISLIAALGITNYAIREGARVRSDKKKLDKFVNEIFSLNILSTLVAYLFLFAMVLFWRKLDNYVPLIWIQALVVIFTTLGMDWMNSIYEDYLFITVRYILCQGIAIIFMFIFVKSSQDYLWYAFSSVLGSVMANIMNIVHIRRHWGIYPHFTLNKEMFRHLKPVVIMFGSSIASLIYINSDVTLLGIMCSDEVVGYYSVSSKIYTLVKQLLNAMLVVAIPRISAEIGARSDKVQDMLNDLLRFLVLMIFPASIGLALLSKNIVLLFAGEEYIAAASSLRLLAVALIFATLACFYINVIMIPYRKEAQILRATLVSAAVNVIFNILLIPYFQENAAAFTTLMSEIVMISMGYWYTRDLFKAHALKSFITAFFGMIWIGIVYTVLMRFNLNNILMIVSTMAGSIIGYGVLLLIFFGSELKTMLPIKKK